MVARASQSSSKLSCRQLAIGLRGRKGAAKIVSAAAEGGKLEASERTRAALAQVPGAAGRASFSPSSQFLSFPPFPLFSLLLLGSLARSGASKSGAVKSSRHFIAKTAISIFRPESFATTDH